MAKANSRVAEPASDINLIPVMNCVMCIIPLLLLMSEFKKPAVVNISSPRNAQATQADPEQQQEEEIVPKVVVSISNDGFRIIAQNQPQVPLFEEYSRPIARCGGGAGAAPGAPSGSPHAMAESLPPTVCLRAGVQESAPLLEKLDYPALYNRLVQIRLRPEWFDLFAQEGNDVISILGDPEVPLEVLTATMDAARNYLQTAGGAAGIPAAGDPSAYTLGGTGGEPTLEEYENADYVRAPDSGQPIPMFPNPVLLLPRPTSGG